MFCQVRAYPPLLTYTYINKDMIHSSQIWYDKDITTGSRTQSHDDTHTHR